MHALGRVWVRLRKAIPIGDGQEEWSLEWSRQVETRWSRPGEIVDCFRFDDGYVTTVQYESRDVTWQLTPGQVPLASALAMATLYLEHKLTPQTDRDGRPFIGLTDHGPVQVFEEIPPEPVEYVYLDGLRTLEEFPEFLTIDDSLRSVFDQMAPAQSSTSR
ncbi:hypothetical protein E6P09_12105 [Haloferax mediterranei ATCC 33500]|uniref:Uncharacterized protein n=1 Tax=Haloferax mediterranei (strain ATCC 33500 / DSM 1411 / JCM 8866 / NBRC 14739 / NCIMB 2177 / R-4) TaxID=523841 RepID=I3R5K9_HALMT|nr:hypothetical protein [Haloferax mediterranei]AFK19519.2 hypothetical protein HFX_1816 [Haloferax mediterranei ATCC 33500]AHZ21140.1 hypothetical protein BM92_00020 [Haloferax mediterranei ATCC 33500]EMA04294.1 hypothetical protein C439_01427 [Haloferax mediterranei ATCC 33500]MDX5989622.1 hypothetical protein [Haloferax mediterranei ATCC 33500]QCQ75976.1 hypothetical protein E6P09_12105 [Haloferax mediterranei ATCC 33500]